jgi:ATP-binding cassette, subfamily B, multidrug efflux pump
LLSKHPRLKALRHLNKYFVKYKSRLLWGALFVTLSNIFAIIPAKVIRYALDLISSGEEPEKIYRLIGLVLLVYIGSTLLRGLFMFFMRQTIIIMSRLVEYDLKNEIFAHYQQLSLGFYRRNNTGDLMARISEDVGRVRMYIGPAIMYTINLVVLFVMIVAAMINVNLKLTLFVLLPLPLLSYLIYKVSHVINHKSEQVQEKLSHLSTFVQEAFSGIRVIKSYVREDNTAREFEQQSEEFKARSMDLARTNAFFAPLMVLLIGLSTIITVYIGGREVMAGNITQGNIAEFIIYINMLTWPVAAVGWVTSLVQRAEASQERINEFLHTQPEIVSPTGAQENIEGRISFRNVSFTYADSGIKALSDVSFSIEPGKSLGIMGRTGSGKSTLANLMLRMYDVQEGSIQVDGRDLHTLNLQELRTSTGYVPQDVFLFSDTIRNNISFGLTHLSPGPELEKQIEEAARDAAIYDNIMEFPEKLGTVIGERGITLSGGQKQRISIARAIIKKPRILVFDDCLSAVDTHTEETILNNLKRVMKNRTSVIISHRVSSVKNADHILILDHGSIVEEGSHAGLMERKGLYFDLYSRQLAEQRLAE